MRINLVCDLAEYRACYITTVEYKLDGSLTTTMQEYFGSSAGEVSCKAGQVRSVAVETVHQTLCCTGFSGYFIMIISYIFCCTTVNHHFQTCL